MSKHNYKKYRIKKDALRDHVSRMHSFALAESIKESLRENLNCFIGQPIVGTTKDVMEHKLFELLANVRMQRDQIIIGYPKVDIYGADAYVSFSVRAPMSSATVLTDMVINLNGDI